MNKKHILLNNIFLCWREFRFIKNIMLLHLIIIKISNNVSTLENKQLLKLKYIKLYGCRNKLNRWKWQRKDVGCCCIKDQRRREWESRGATQHVNFFAINLKEEHIPARIKTKHWVQQTISTIHGLHRATCFNHPAV